MMPPHKWVGPRGVAEIHPGARVSNDVMSNDPIPRRRSIGRDAHGSLTISDAVNHNVFQGNMVRNTLSVDAISPQITAVYFYMPNFNVTRVINILRYCGLTALETPGVTPLWLP